MVFRVEQAAIDAYERDGAVALRQVVAETELTQLASAIEDDMRSPGPFFHGYESEEGRFHGNLRLWETHDTFRNICLHSGLPAIAQTFLGSSKINLLYDQLFVKEAHTRQRTRWRNDQPYWPIRGAGGNRPTNRRRRGYTVRYTGDDVTYDLRPGLSPPLVCEELEQGQALDSPRYPVVIR